MGHVCWRSQRCPRSVACIFKDRRTTQSQRFGRSSSDHQTRVKKKIQLPSKKTSYHIPNLIQYTVCQYTTKEMKKKTNLKESQCFEHVKVSIKELNISTHAFEKKS